MVVPLILLFSQLISLYPVPAFALVSCACWHCASDVKSSRLEDTFKITKPSHQDDLPSPIAKPRSLELCATVCITFTVRFLDWLCTLLHANKSWIVFPIMYLLMMKQSLVGSKNILCRILTPSVCLNTIESSAFAASLMSVSR